MMLLGGNRCPWADLSRTYVDFARLNQLTEWWHWMLLIGISGLLIVYVVAFYRRDAGTLPRGVRWSMTILRLTAFVGILLFFLDLEKRTERELTRTSRVAVLVDTSQSMGLVDSSAGAKESRLSQVVAEFGQGPILSELQKKHDVTVYRFDQGSNPELVASLEKEVIDSAEVLDDSDQQRALQLPVARRWITVALGILVAAVLCFLLQAIVGRRLRGAEGESYLVLLGSVASIVAVVIAGIVLVRYPQLAVAEVIRGELDAKTRNPSGPAIPGGESPASQVVHLTPTDIDWATQLVPRGVETRLGEAIGWILQKERDAPLAGVVVLSDGQNNAGTTPETTTQVAKANEVPIYPIGLGSEKQPKSVRLVDLESPPRVYPGDPFEVTGYVQADGLRGRTITVTLEQRDANNESLNPPRVVERRLPIGEDGEITSIKFEVIPEELGRQQWVMRVRPNPADDLDDRDNQRSSMVEVIERKTRVLLLAGGPTREYRFVRNLFYRDSQSQVDVLLQTAPPGAAQEANEILTEFPEDRETMFEYDAVVAFDPDWMALSLEQIKLLDEWVAENAGGLVVLAGPVHTARWSRGIVSRGDEPKVSIIRDLYPVTFYRSGSASIQLGRVSSDTAWPLEFTDEGRRAQFLWLEDSPTGSEQAWNEFEGVYGYQAIRDVKPGAQVYARFSDPQSGSTDDLPVYMAGQFYGAGRVFYLGSGEMWRLNAIDPTYFETFYTKLVRHVSQGRLLRDSSRGLLLVDNERVSLGDTVTVRAVLSDAQYQPLTLDQVDAMLLSPDGRSQPFRLNRLANAERPGMYTAQFTTSQEGEYRVDLAMPDDPDEILSREVKVRLPAREIERPQRNDSLLSSLAQQTEGQYFVGLGAARGERGSVPLTSQILTKDQVTYLNSTPDRDFERRWMGWLMAAICGALSLEWLIRRLYKLA